MSDRYFKQCMNCQDTWETRDDFIADTEVRLLGFQANFVAPEKGLFLFNHSCDGTMSIEVLAFADLYAGPIYLERKITTEDCPEYCLHPNDLRPCPIKCHCFYVREIIDLLKTAETIIPERRPHAS